MCEKADSHKLDDPKQAVNFKGKVRGLGYLSAISSFQTFNSTGC